MKKLKQLRITKILVTLSLLLFINSCSNEEIFNETESANFEKKTVTVETEIIKLTKKTRRFHNFKVALVQGYDLEVTGYVPQMGYHYLNVNLLDENFELEKPEILQYAPDDNGVMQFVGVEYAVPIADINNPPPAPEGFTGDSDEWHINYVFELWTLHVWVGLYNPDGIFAPFNPDLD